MTSNLVFGLELVKCDSALSLLEEPKVIEGNNILKFADDVDTIQKLSRQYRNELPFVMKPQILESLKSQELSLLTSGNYLLGFVRWHLRRDGITTIYDLAIDQRYLRRGGAKRLLDTLKLPLRLKVTVDNVRAISFYKKYGFELIKEIQGRKRKLLLFEKHEK